MLKGNILFNATSWVYDFYKNDMAPLRGHKYHILPTSSSPIAISFALLSFLLVLVFDFHGSKVFSTFFDSFSLFLINFFEKKIFFQTEIYDFIQTEVKRKKLFFQKGTYDFIHIEVTRLRKVFYYTPKYNQIHLFWLAPFFLTLGFFLVWSSFAVDEGTSFKINSTTFFYNSFLLAAKPNVEPLFHTNLVWKGFKIGFILFIISEVMFFFGFFWGFFHSSISPTIQIGAVWPPLDVEFITVKGFAVANTVILLTSGATLTVAHYGFELIPQKKNKLFTKNIAFTDSSELFKGKLLSIYTKINKEIFRSAAPEIYKSILFHWVKRRTLHALPRELWTVIIPFKILFNPLTKYFQRNFGLKETETIVRIYVNLMLNATLALAILFMTFQGTEYFISPVSINSGVYGSTFYMITGLHGAHVFIGTCFLLYCRMAVSNWWNMKSLIIYFTYWTDLGLNARADIDITEYFDDTPYGFGKDFAHYIILEPTLDWALRKSMYLPLYEFPLNEKYTKQQELVDLSSSVTLPERTTTINNYGKYGIESFESAAWYWHFVDVVWIFVFGFVYIWSHLTVLNLQ